MASAHTDTQNYTYHNAEIAQLIKMKSVRWMYSPFSHSHYEFE